MQNTFSRSIHGHDLQFNRFLYPTRYTVKLDEPGSDGKQYEFTKDSGAWVLSETEVVPDWLLNISGEINKVIKENESNF